MAAWMVPVAMMAAGGAKGHLDSQQAARQRQAEAEIARWSPWTGMAPQRVSDGGGVLGGMMQGGLTGASLMQEMGESGGGESAANLSDTTPGAPASSSTGEPMPSPMMAYQPQKYSLYGPGEQRPAWLEMGQTPQYMTQQR